VLAWAIAQHDAFWTSAESDFLIFLFGQGKLQSAYRKSYVRPDEGWLKKHGVSFPEFASEIGKGVDALFLSRSKGRRWVDSTPGHTLMAEDLAVLFPEARFLHILRDGRSVVHSMINTGFNRLGFEKIGMKIPWAENFDSACSTWVHYVTRGREFAKAHPDRCLELRQEDLIMTPEEVFRVVFDFLGVSYTEASPRFVHDKRLNSSFDPGGKTVVERSGEGETSALPRPWAAWNNRMKRKFQKIAGPAMADMGYAMDD
jgi:hypothetical protein